MTNAFTMRPTAFGLVMVALLTLGTPRAQAGGGPENVLLVINTTSQDSLEVGNQYARLRNLPASNVLYLDYQGDREEITGEVFRTQILGPILAAIDSRQLGLQIDMIAYSCDFPWRIQLRGDFPKEEKFPSQAKPIASLTGATSLWEAVMTKDRRVTAMDANRYVPQLSVKNLSRCKQVGESPSRGFRSRYRWLAGGLKSDDPGLGSRYFLSTMLGVTTGRGNTVEEILASLRRSAYADTSPPQGAFYFMRNGDIRSKTRHACYEGVAHQLRTLGGKAVVAEGVLPKGKVRVAGMTLGKANLGISRGQFTIEPGAICEHLTSYGGDLSKRAGQTPLTDLIRAGASGASGTVVEPYAIQAKFPLPMVQLHYRRGCSLAEAFYQSVASPYQLLIVGDPLCQPWATRPGVSVPGWTPGGELKLSKTVPESSNTPQKQEEPEEIATPKAGEPPKATKATLALSPRIAATAGQGTPFWELYINGQLRMRMPSGRGVRFTATQLGFGWHDLRCVASNPDSIESQGSLHGWIEVPSPEGGPVRIRPSGLVANREGEISLELEAEGAERMVVLQHSREVAHFEGNRGKVSLSGTTLGRGPVRLQARAEPSGAMSPPIWIVVQ